MPEERRRLVLERDPMIGTTIGAHHEIRRLLGRGGMASVYEATAPGERVAIKVIEIVNTDEQSTLESYRVRRFLREARATRAIESPNVVRVIDADTDPTSGRPYIVMEMLHGRDLHRAGEVLGPLEPVAAARIFLQACSGLRAAHALGIIHRDLKPANIFLAEQGELIVVKICDFGTAKLALDASSLTGTGVLLGSPRYMSPEQLLDARSCDPRSDIWSLAASLFEALAGVPMWREKGMSDLLQAIRARPVPRLDKLATWLDPALVAVVHRALERDPAKRYASVDELASALRPFAEGTMTLRKEELRGQPGSTRPVGISPTAPTVTAPRAAPSAAPPDVGPAPPAARRLRRELLLAMAAVVALAVLAGRGLVHSPRQYTVTIPVVPAAISIEVEGEPRALQAGALVLRGAPGQVFRVSARDGDRRLEETVVITKTGGARPDHLDWRRR